MFVNIITLLLCLHYNMFHVCQLLKEISNAIKTNLSPPVLLISAVNAPTVPSHVFYIAGPVISIGVPCAVMMFALSRRMMIRSMLKRKWRRFPKLK